MRDQPLACSGTCRIAVVAGAAVGVGAGVDAGVDAGAAGAAATCGGSDQVPRDLRQPGRAWLQG